MGSKKILYVVAFLATFFHFNAFAQTSNNEQQCLKGSAEACFYTGADYAQGLGVAEDKQKAVSYFLKACEMGIPDGCTTSGYITFNGDGIPADKQKGIQYFEMGCAKGHVDGCDKAIGQRLSESSPVYDLNKAMASAKSGCKAGVQNPCLWGMYWAYDGGEGKYPSLINKTEAAWFGEATCRNYNDKLGCWIAETSFADPKSTLFDAEKGLQYSLINCDSFQGMVSCANVGGVYLQIEEYELGATYLQRACDLGNTESCSYAKDWATYNAEMVAYKAKMAELNAMVNGPISQGQFGQAVSNAVNQAGSTSLAEKAIMAASNAGKMSQISTNDLYAVALWFQSGPVRSAADKELAARGTGLEGTFGTGTNTPGAADARWKSMYGSSAPRVSSSSSSPALKAMPSSSEISAQTKQRYRYAHCVMSGSNTSAKVCQ